MNKNFRKNFEREIDKVYVKARMKEELSLEESKFKEALHKTEKFLKIYDKIEGTNMVIIFKEWLSVSPNRRCALTTFALQHGYSVRSLGRYKNKIIEIFNAIYEDKDLSL